MGLIDFIKYWIDRHYDMKQDQSICKACEIREIELSRAHDLINRLTTSKPTEAIIPPKEEEEIKPIVQGRKFIPFAVRQQMQSMADQKTLELMQLAHARQNQVEEVKIEEVKIDETKINEMERDILSAEVSK